MGTTRVNFRLPEDLVKKTDVVAEVTRNTRTDIVVEALQAYHAEATNHDEFVAALVEHYLDDEIGFDVLKAFVGRQDAAAVRASKALLDQGDEVVEDLADLE